MQQVVGEVCSKMEVKTVEVQIENESKRWADKGLLAEIKQN